MSYTDWDLNIIGQPGQPQGPAGTPGTPGAPGTMAPMPGFLCGLTLSNDVASGLIDIAPGAACSDDGTTTMVLPSTIVKSIGAWVAGNGGGLDTGTFAVAWYHFFLIYNPTTSTADIIYSQSLTAPVMPSGYTKKRRIGTISALTTSTWYAFQQLNNQFLWMTPITNYNGTANASMVQQPVLSVPPGIKTLAHFSLVYQNGAINTAIYINSGDLPNNSWATGGIVGNSSLYCMANQIVAAEFTVRTNITQNIWYYINTTGTGNTYINTKGWTDFRGQ